jgi:uncharacterized protein YecT (DUF1311 family)
MNEPSASCQNAGSEVDVTVCFSEAYNEADGELNRVYRQIMSVLNQREQSSLRAAQRAWLNYRDLACEAEAEPYRGRSGEGQARLACLEAATKARIEFVKRGLWWKVEKFAD